MAKTDPLDLIRLLQKGASGPGEQPTGDPWTDILEAVRAAGREDDVQRRLDDLLVDGRLLLTEAALEQLKADAAVADGEVNLPAWALISVLAIPDDGAPHDIGNGKVAIVSPFDHRSILVMPAELAGPWPRPRSV